MMEGWILDKFLYKKTITLLCISNWDHINKIVMHREKLQLGPRCQQIPSRLLVGCPINVELCYHNRGTVPRHSGSQRR